MTRLRLPGSVLALTLLFLAGCSGPPSEGPGSASSDDDLPAWLAEIMAQDAVVSPQATSLFGEALFAEAAEPGAFFEADQALRGDPDNLDLILEAGRVRRGPWHYRQEIAFYDRAIELAPGDWRAWRFRGHRRLSLRDFEGGVADLERARELAPLNWDVAYHLGLAYFYQGRFGHAANEYLRCLNLSGDGEAAAADSPGFRSCSANADDPESRVAMTEWAVRALLRDGRAGEAEALWTGLPDNLDVSTNVAYHHNLLLYRGEKTEEALLNPDPDGPYRLETVGFGVANWRLAQGDTVGARELLEVLNQDPWWPGFGRIAAEVELARIMP